MGHPALAGDDVLFAVAVEVSEGNGVDLGPGVVDHVFDPLSVGALFHPEEAVVVGVAEHEVISAIVIDVVDVDEADVDLHIPVGMPFPIGGLKPAFGGEDVGFAVFVYVAGADAVSEALVADGVLFPSALDEFVPGGDGLAAAELGEDFEGFAVVVEVDEEGELDVFAFFDHVLFPGAGFPGGVFPPGELAAEPIAADDIDVAVGVDVDGEVTEVVDVVIVEIEFAEAGFFPGWRGVPVFAGDDIEFAVAVDVGESAGLVGAEIDGVFFEGNVGGTGDDGGGEGGSGEPDGFAEHRVQFISFHALRGRWRSAVRGKARAAKQLPLVYDGSLLHAPTDSMKSRVFSGVQPTGNLHIGNYLGAIKNFVRLQHDYECIFCVVDLHAITVYQKPEELRAKILEIAGLFLAAGIDPKVSSLIVQSAVPAHAELSWMLTCVTPLGWLHRMTQFKSKAEQWKQKIGSGQDDALASVGSGLLQYPVLMAADILLYNAAIVPVGDDQAQHLELTRDIAERFNSLYGETFVVPATKLPTVGARVMGLDDPGKKMSKSAAGSGHAIGLLDAPEVARKKIMRAVTDTQAGVNFESMGEGVANLLGIFQAFSEWDDAGVRAHFEGKRYGDLKKDVAEMVLSHLEPFQRRYREITADAAYLDGVLAEGAARVTPIADGTIRTVKQRMGLYAG